MAFMPSGVFVWRFRQRFHERSISSSDRPRVSGRLKKKTTAMLSCGIPRQGID